MVDSIGDGYGMCPGPARLCKPMACLFLYNTEGSDNVLELLLWYVD